MPPQSQSATIEIYEDRIQRLEDGVTDCKVDLGVVKQQIASGVQMLSDKLDAVASLEHRVTALETRKKIEDELKVEKELESTKRKEKRMWRLKVWGAIGSAIAGLIGLLIKIAGG